LDGCIPPDPTNDYIDTYGNGPALVYSRTDSGLVIYDDAGLVGMREPVKPWPRVKVAVGKTRAWSDMLHNPDKYGVTVLKVPLNQICWRNFFAKLGTRLRNGP
jgi:hypothetical protein